MLKQTRETDLALFVELGEVAASDDAGRPARCASSFPAYAISELKTGFQMGFFLFVPFLLIDLVVSTTLLSMGMLQLPPAMISLPFKVLLFVMIDGWNLLVGSLVRSFMLRVRMSEALVVGIVRQAIETGRDRQLPMLARRSRGRRAGQHLPDRHVDPGQRARVHSARRGDLRRVRAHVSRGCCAS